MLGVKNNIVKDVHKVFVFVLNDSSVWVKSERVRNVQKVAVVALDDVVYDAHIPFLEGQEAYHVVTHVPPTVKQGKGKENKIVYG